MPSDYTQYLTSWTCHICGDRRPDDCISVFTTDLSEEHGLVQGTITQHVRYCNDRPGCIEAAKTHRLLPDL